MMFAQFPFIRSPWLERAGIALVTLVLIAVAVRDPWGVAAEALPAVFLTIALIVARCGDHA